MVYTKFVEIGRIALLNCGKYVGKLVVIVDVIDQNRALVDGPSTGVPRMAANFKSLYLTDFKVKIQHSTRSKGVRKVLEEADILTKWNETACAKKMAQRRLRKGLSDFDRFKVKILKQQKMRIVRGEVKKLKKQN